MHRGYVYFDEAKGATAASFWSLASLLVILVLSSGPEDGLKSYVFPLAILLTKDKKVVLLPMKPRVLICTFGRVCRELTWLLGRQDVVSRVDSGFL